MAPTIFISHADTDATQCTQLENHLTSMSRAGLIRVWHRRMVPPGEDTGAATRKELDAAEIILLLVSPEFVSTESCNVEVNRAMARHDAGEARVVPILLRSVDVRGMPFASLSFLPKDRRPIGRAADPDEAWEQVTAAIRSIIEDRPWKGEVELKSGSVRAKPRSGDGRVGLYAGLLVGLIAISAGIWAMVRTPRLRTPPDQINLMWAPADCPQREPFVAYDSCAELRGLPWLQSQLNLLRASGVRGFVDLPNDPRLEPASYAGKENLILKTWRGNQHLLVGVGYRREDRAKDGCLRIYDATTFERWSGTACLTKDGQWWVKDKDDDLYQPLDR